MRSIWIRPFRESLHRCRPSRAPTSTPNAFGLVRRGVEILNRLPDTPERAQQELDFQASLGLALMLTKGFAASEVGPVNVQAAELCQQIGEQAPLFPLLSSRHPFGIRLYVKKAHCVALGLTFRKTTELAAHLI